MEVATGSLMGTSPAGFALVSPLLLILCAFWDPLVWRAVTTVFSALTQKVSAGRSFKDHLVLPLYFSNEEIGPGTEVPWAKVAPQVKSTTMNRAPGS